MKAIKRNINFFTLRKAYLEVQRFIENETHRKIDCLNTRLVKDLGLSGDDNYELLVKFIKTYKLNADSFDYMKHFHTEYELYGSEQAGFNLIKISLYLILTLIRFLTLGKIKADLVQLNVLDVQRQVTDMTVGDMVTWYLEKEYRLRGDINYKIINTA